MGSMRKQLFTCDAKLVVGFSLCIAWIYSVITSEDVFYVAFHVGIGVCLLVVARLYRSAASVLSNRVVLSASCVAMLCASASAILGRFDQPDWAFAILAMLSGIGAAIVFSRWFERYSVLSEKGAVGNVLLAFSLSSLMRFLLMVLNSVSLVATGTVLAILPVVSVCVLLSRERGPGSKETSVCSERDQEALVQPPSKQDVSPSVRNWFIGKIGAVGFLVEFVLFGLMFGLTHDGFIGWSNQVELLLFGHALRMLIPLVFFFWLNSPKEEEFNGTVLRVVLTVVAVLILALMYFGNAADSLVFALIFVGQTLVYVLMYVVAIEMVKLNAADPLFSYGLMRGSFEIMSALGVAFSIAFSAFRFPGEAIGHGMAYFLASCIFLLLLNGFARISRLLTSRPVSFEPMSIEKNCEEIAKRYNLTERELEVMKMLCAGRTKAYIAETLYLSESTIRWHAKALYRKLSIHSKQELLTMVGIR